ncbi:DUF4249 domain-containing protein [Mucilaginibacter sp. OK098]|uniref:DUF4249 domain-containing protein n=1 Tax=Mucilaginibacter sp. OK098 TaxID=1855297 RepID=UPI0009219C77|nr:DUF4249 domain-containing protein [Mucilaginibacter sp. OK098]SHN31972.1 protein of unknown function [Mucilaginibacter sp. OK098]
MNEQINNPKFLPIREDMRNWKTLLFVIMLAIGCKKPYNPKVISSPNSYLVVEGVINTNDVTTIKLSRTVNLSSGVTTNPIQANLVIECDNGSNYGLNEVGNGVYQLAGVTLDNTRKFRLRITTSDNNKVYLSDYEQAKITPPIDSVGFIANGNKLQLYANTHDPNNNTHYYRFDYTETWKFHSLYYSTYLSNGTAIVARNSDQLIYYCFANSTSSTIILGSTAKLTQDLLFQAPLTAIESTSEKIELKYSILVHEYALTAAGYKFWESLKTNTEQLGSIFDAEPSQLIGNIHNIADASEPVIGYISTSTIQSKRIFITSEQLPQSWKPNYPYECNLDSFLYDRPKTHINEVAQTLIPGIEIPVSGIYTPAGLVPIGYTGSGAFCVDCTLRGSKQQPDFWK